jgi:hypothetical protein
MSSARRDLVNFHYLGFNPVGSEFITLHGGTAIIAADYPASSGYPRNLGQKGWALGGSSELVADRTRYQGQVSFDAATQAFCEGGGGGGTADLFFSEAQPILCALRHLRCNPK